MTGGGSRRRNEVPLSATEIETEIRRTRVELGLTLDALEHQLAPRHLIGKGIDMLTQSIKGNETIKGNGAASAGAVLEQAGECTEYRKPATERVRRAGRSLRASVERHPLLVGLAGLICGAALGALLPSSRREQDWVDAARGELWEKAEQIGHEAADRVRGLAEQKADAAGR